MYLQTYAALISGYCEAGTLAAACGLLDVMRTNGLEPGFMTYTALVAGKEVNTVLFMCGQWFPSIYCYCVANPI